MDWKTFEKVARARMSKEFKSDLTPSFEGISINGKSKKFDMENTPNKIVGDAKFYTNTSGGNIPSAKRSTANEYAFLMQKLGPEWRKFLVFGNNNNNEDMARKYVEDFKRWLVDENTSTVEVYFYDWKNDKLTLILK